MNQEGWFELIRDANWRYEDSADRSQLDLLAQLLAEQDAAKERLRVMRFGCIGTPWPEVVQQVVDRGMNGH